jgi:hypothetical protein
MLAHKLRDRAKREIVQIFLEYEAIEPDLGYRFLTKLAERIDLNQHVPEMYTIERGVYRIGQMKPYLEALWRGRPHEI